MLLHKYMVTFSYVCKSFTKRWRYIAAVLVVFFLAVLGVFDHIFEKDFYTDFHYPYDGDIQNLVVQLRRNITPLSDNRINNEYHTRLLESCRSKCDQQSSVRLLYLIKSAVMHFQNRAVIRNSWGFEKRFSDVNVKTVFLLGVIPHQEQEAIQSRILEESNRFHDIVQGDFIDVYENNTLKTMMAFRWASNFCPQAEFYMFVDDDYYVSTKNVLRFVRNPTGYSPNVGKHQQLLSRNVDGRLYAGFRFDTAPLRHWFSKWYVSLAEYPYHKWPPYITAGAYILSKSALLDMYFASFYTKHFRFDDIYVGLLALKTHIEPLHSAEFHFNKAVYNPAAYTHLIASHGYNNADELLSVWTEQRSLGHA